MPEVLQAQAAYKQAELDALKIRFRARATLGEAILAERKRTRATQSDVAKELGVVAEQVRRYEAACREWARKYPEEPLTAERLP